jgi:predicted RNase H-like nuclease (RuvC/YqgF family)
MNTRIICKILSPEGEHAKIQEEVTRNDNRSERHTRFEEHYSSQNPIQLQATLKSFADDCARLEWRNRLLERENENLKRALKGHRAAIEVLESKVKEDWAQLV